jgi:hypothetical protein
MCYITGMRKWLIPAGMIAGLFLLAGLGLVNIVLSAYGECVYVDPNRSERNVVLFGRVESIKEQNGWIITRLKLCGSGLAGMATVKVLTRADAGLVDIGEEGEYRGKPVFHWIKRDMGAFREFVAPGRFLALRPEETESETAGFLAHLKQKNMIGLAVDLGLGRAVVYSREFDQVGTAADFRRLAKRLVL